MSSKEYILLVLAAGIGRRFGGLKQVEPVGPNRELIIHYSIHDALKAGFTRIIFVIRREIEALFHQVVTQFLPKDIHFQYVYQELQDLPPPYQPPKERIKPWGTGHAIWIARNHLIHPFAVINADDFYGPTGYHQIIQFFQSSPSLHHHCLIAYQLSNTVSQHGTVSRGVCTIDTNNQLVHIQEFTHIQVTNHTFYNPPTQTFFTGQEPVSMNFWGFAPSILDLFDQELHQFLKESSMNPNAEFFLPSVIAKGLQQNRIKVQVLPSCDPWFGITYPEDLPEVKAGIQQLIQKGIYSSPLWKS